jgi:hypothetical protein
MSGGSVRLNAATTSLAVTARRSRVSPCSIFRARPKSTTLIAPESATTTFSGLMSRCRMPAACAASTACATFAQIAISCARVLVPARSTSRSVRPGRYSIAMKS